MKLTNAILAVALSSGTAWAQNGPVIIQQAKTTADAAQQKQNSNVKAVSAATPAQASKPSAATKPSAVQASKTPAGKATAVQASGSKPLAKPVVQPVKANAGQPVIKPAVVSSKPAVSSVVAAPKTVAVKPAVKPVGMKTVTVKAAPRVATAIKKTPVKEVKAEKVKPSEKENVPTDVAVEKAPEPAKSEKARTINANGRRDPFISPVVSQSAVGSGCSTGKRCLAVDQISLKGVVRSETGMIAVVVNAIDKAYFLRENDPVFDGYVLKITSDSIVFKETVQDKLGKPFTKEVTKKITTPAV
jgi:Tfp pilus assembly protein PilP